VTEKNILAVIPARGGSKAVPRKNIRDLMGKPLIAHTILEAKRSRLLTHIIVSTDDEDIKTVSLHYGAEVPFLRPRELATDTALAVPTVQHAVSATEALKKMRYDYIVMLQPTAPLRTCEDIDNALKRLIHSEAEGIISVVDVDNWHPMKMKRFEENGMLVDYEPPPVENPPRQILPKVYMVNGAIYATRRDVFMAKGTFKGDKCLGYIMPAERSVNIDTDADFLVAEYYLKNRKSPDPA
jgi:CMP-N,N'-diacetyllegionaminic acid synthase